MMNVNIISLIENNIDYIVNECVFQIKHSEEYNSYIEEQRTALWKRLDKEAQKYEKKFIITLKDLFEEQKKEVLANLKRSRKSYITKQNVDTYMFGKKTWEKRFKKEGENFYKGTIIDYGDRAFDEFDVIGLTFDIYNPEVSKFIEENGLFFGKNTMDTAYEDLKKTFIEGLEAGEGIPELSKRVNNVYSGYIDGKMWKAARIAQTETIKSVNFGTFVGYKQSGVVKKKEWVATRSDWEHVRDTHKEMDGVDIELNEPFVLPDGDKMMYPGDTSLKASSENTINDRCRIVGNT
ncbi:MAG: phage minor head protein [Candidatus Thorarchaeota archaeon]